MVYLELVLRWAHILAAITAVGGTMFMRLALYPALQTLDEAARKQVQQQVRARWAPLVHLSIAFLLASGFYNFFSTVRHYEVPPYYHAAWGIKFLIALVIFYIAESFMGRSERAERMRTRAGFWLSVNLTLAVIVVLISGFLRSVERHPKQPAQSAPPASSAPVAS